MKNNIITISLFLLVSMGASATTFDYSTSYSTNMGWSDVPYYTTNNTRASGPVSATLSHDQSIDATAQQITFSNFGFAVSDFSHTETKEVIYVPPGTITPVTLSIVESFQFDAFSISTADEFTSSYTCDGVICDLGSLTGFTQDGATYNLTGSYLVSVDGVSDSGNFSVAYTTFGLDEHPIDWVAGVGFYTFDLSSSPEEIAFASGFSEIPYLFGFSTDESIVTGQIGVYEYDLSPDVMFGSSSLMVTPSEVPIPAAAWLFGSALLGLGAMKRKTNSRSTPS
jgi:hypothetical protein